MSTQTPMTTTVEQFRRGHALVLLAEAIEAAKWAGMTCAELCEHLGVMWRAVPVEDHDNGRIRPE